MYGISYFSESFFFWKMSHSMFDLILVHGSGLYGDISSLFSIDCIFCTRLCTMVNSDKTNSDPNSFISMSEWSEWSDLHLGGCPKRQE